MNHDIETGNSAETLIRTDIEAIFPGDFKNALSFASD
jgi:hypothetical protein